MKTLHHTGVIIFMSLFFILFGCPLSADNDGSLHLKTVVIDAGHGGHDPGCVSRDGKVYEKNINLDIAKKLGAKISAAYPDVKVIYTRKTDVFVTLNGRADIANRNNANLFISIHVNAATATSAHGFSTHILGSGEKDRMSSNMEVSRRENSVILLEDDYSTTYQDFDPNAPESFIFFNLMQNAYYEQSVAFAAEADKEMLKGPVKHSRGIWQDPLLVLWRTKMPAVLVEVGFMSNSSDLKILSSAANRTMIADKLFEAFKSFKAKYDASMDFTIVTEPEPQPEEPASEAVSQGSGTEYGVQIFAVGRVIEPGDKAFKGYDVVSVKSGNLYKYIIKAADADAARSLFKKVKKTFHGSFPVKIENGVVSAL